MLTSYVSIDAAVGPSGNWQVSVPTYGPSLIGMIATMRTWPRIAASSRPAGDGEVELDWVTPLEGGVEFALVATDTGLAVDVRESWMSGGVQPHTRVRVSLTDLDRFVHHLSKASEGRGLGASLGTRPSHDEYAHSSHPLIAIEPDLLTNLADPYLPPIACPITSEDIAWVRTLLTELVPCLGPLPSWRAQEKSLKTSPSGELTVALTCYCDEDNTRLAQVTVGTHALGPLWSMRLGRDEARASAAHATVSRAILIGDVSTRPPL